MFDLILILYYIGGCLYIWLLNWSALKDVGLVFTVSSIFRLLLVAAFAPLATLFAFLADFFTNRMLDIGKLFDYLEVKIPFLTKKIFSLKGKK